MVGDADTVTANERCESLLGYREVGERRCIADELSAQTAKEPLDSAGRRRTSGLGQSGVDTVAAADRLEQHLGRRMVEPTGEKLSVVGQDLVGAP
jgi:hypothetical protein